MSEKKTLFPAEIQPRERNACCHCGRAFSEGEGRYVELQGDDVQASCLACHVPKRSLTLELAGQGSRP